MIYSKRLFWIIVYLVITPTLLILVSGCDPNSGGTVSMTNSMGIILYGTNINYASNP